MSNLQTYIVHRTHLRSPDTLSSSIDMSESKYVVLADEAEAEIARIKNDCEELIESERTIMATDYNKAEAEIARLGQTLEEIVAILEGFLTEDTDDPVVLAYETAQKALGDE